MIRIAGFMKVATVLALDFFTLSYISGEPVLAAFIVGWIAVYVLSGGSLTVAREGGVHMDRLPEYERMKLCEAKEQIVEAVRSVSSADLSGLRIYLIPGDDDLQATAYGENRISVSAGMLRNADPITLNAVLAHEAAHILNSDPEFSRAVFCSVTLLISALSILSATTVIIVFFLFLVLSFFRSFFGFLVFRGTTGLFRGFFSLIQKAVVFIYRTFLGIANCHAEYRSDQYACELGYGVQLSHYLRYAGRDPSQQMTLTELLYRSHPPTPERIARIEAYLLKDQPPDETMKRYGGNFK